MHDIQLAKLSHEQPALYSPERELVFYLFGPVIFAKPPKLCCSHCLLQDVVLPRTFFFFFNLRTASPQGLRLNINKGINFIVY